MTKRFQSISYLILLCLASLSNAQSSCSWEDHEIDMSWYDTTLDPGTCVTCPDNCSSCQPTDNTGENLRCNYCVEGYYLTLDFECLPCVDGCGHCVGPELEDCDRPLTGEYFDHDSESFEDCKIEHCGYCSKDGNTCYGCDSGYYNEYDSNYAITSCLLCEIDHCQYCYANYNFFYEYYYPRVEKETSKVDSTSDVTEKETPSSVSCSYCEYPYQWDYADEECKMCDIENCQWCGTMSNKDGSTYFGCSYCESGYAVQEDGSCKVGDVEHCTSYYSGSCSYCESGYSLSDGECISCTNIDPHCAYCYPNYTYNYPDHYYNYYYKMNSTDEIIQEDVEADEDKDETEDENKDEDIASSPTSEPATSGMVAGDSGSGSSFDTIYNGLICSTCEEGYYYHYEEKECQECPNGCSNCYGYYNYTYDKKYTVTSQDFVVECYDNYYHQCGIGENYDYEKKICYKIDIEGCLYSYQEGKCSSCVDGYYVNDKTGICEPCDSSCVSCSGPNSYDCTSCAVNKYTYFDPTHIREWGYVMYDTNMKGAASNTSASNPNYEVQPDDAYSQVVGERRILQSEDAAVGVAYYPYEDDWSYYNWIWQASINCVDTCPTTVVDAFGNDVNVIINDLTYECYGNYSSYSAIPFNATGLVETTDDPSELADMANDLAYYLNGGTTSSSSSGESVEAMDADSSSKSTMAMAPASGASTSNSVQEHSGAPCSGNGNLTTITDSLGNEISVCKCIEGYTGLQCEFSASLIAALQEQVTLLIENMNNISITSASDAQYLMATAESVVSMNVAVKKEDLVSLIGKLSEVAQYLDNSTVNQYVEVISSALEQSYLINLVATTENSSSDSTTSDVEEEESTVSSDGEEEESTVSSDVEEEESTVPSDAEEEEQNSAGRLLENTDNSENILQQSLNSIDAMLENLNYTESTSFYLNTSSQILQIYVQKLNATDNVMLVNNPSHYDSESSSFSYSHAMSNITFELDTTAQDTSYYGIVAPISESAVTDELSEGAIATDLYLVEIRNEDAEMVYISNMNITITIEISSDRTSAVGSVIKCGRLDQDMMVMNETACETVSNSTTQLKCLCHEAGAVAGYVSQEDLDATFGTNEVDVGSPIYLFIDSLILSFVALLLLWS